MIQRIFYKVGNGLFSLELTDNMVNVYDCGSLNKNTIDQAIGRIPSGLIPAIDNLFISHYDKDHVNGLLSLFAKYKVRNLILPMIPNLSRIINCSSVSNSFLFYFIQDPVGYIANISPETRVLQIDQSDGQEGEGEYNMEETRSGQILNGRNVKISFNDWVFIVYNRRILTPQELTMFMGKFGLTSTASTQDIINALAKAANTSKQNTLKAALKGILTTDEIRDINDYSLVLWSGPADLRGGGCLYTGDYNAKKYYPELDLIYKPIKPISQIIQIPHHGSDNNFSLNLCQQTSIHVISADLPPAKSRAQVDPSKVMAKLASNNFIERNTLHADMAFRYP